MRRIVRIVLVSVALTWLVVAGCTAQTGGGDDASGGVRVPDPPASRPIVGVRVEDANSYLVPQPEFPLWCGDLWPQAWADNGYLYAANGDGFAFGLEFGDMKMSRIFGRPPDMRGDPLPGAAGAALGHLWLRPAWRYSRKPTGLICVEGVLYLFYQNLAASASGNEFNEAPVASLSWSADYGQTWRSHDEPMFTDHVFTTGFFLDYGKCNAHARDEYVYVYGLDFNWRSAPGFKQTDLFLARVPKDRLSERAAWEFYVGEQDGAPLWSDEIVDRAPVLHDPLEYGVEGHTGVAQGSVVYIPAARRYLYSTWSWTAWIFWESPEPWGPWTKVAVKWWHEEWTDNFHGGYPTVVPSKFINDNGREAWIVSSLNTVFDNTYYRYAMRRMWIDF
jgi:Domain of unknown function (DUF4185)